MQEYEGQSRFDTPELNVRNALKRSDMLGELVAQGALAIGTGGYSLLITVPSYLLAKSAEGADGQTAYFDKKVKSYMERGYGQNVELTTIAAIFNSLVAVLSVGMRPCHQLMIGAAKAFEFAAKDTEFYKKRWGDNTQLFSSTIQGAAAYNGHIRYSKEKVEEIKKYAHDPKNLLQTIAL